MVGSASAVLSVLGMMTAATAFILVVWGANALLSPRRPNPEKDAPYECGLPPAGSAWASYRVRFSTVALLLVLFDAEAVLLFAVVPALKGSPAGVLEVGAFTGMLAVGLAYAWRKGALKWPS